MKNIIPLVLLSVVACTAVAGNARSLIPVPVAIELQDGSFTLSGETIIVTDAMTQPEGNYLAELLRPATGYALPINTEGPDSQIVLRVDEELTGLGAEGYRLVVEPEAVEITGASRAGVFYGIQSLRQMLPPEIEQDSVLEEYDWTVPCVVIEDQPRFKWRGQHLDVCRHMFTVDEIKRQLDLMALHKLNTFHLHLTEDQGWRIEIKKYPKLTEVGAWRKESPRKGNRKQGDGTPYGGFYTQDELRDIVAYAAARHITVVPEIEMPGHSVAALAAYPELGCTGGPYEVRTRWGVEKDVYCAGNDEVYRFLEDVLTEVLDIFPSTFIHVGGDECPKVQWKACEKCQARIEQEGLKDEHELQSYFIQYFDKWLAAQGRRLIGWDEILEGGLAPDAAVMSWRGIKGGIAAANSGHDVVMSPNSHCYFDYGQAKMPGEPEVIGGNLPLQKVYSYEPIPAELAANKTHHILGAQGNLWSEYIYDVKKLDYQTFPRLTALSEVVWSPVGKRQYDDFRRRLGPLLERMRIMGVNFRDPAKDTAKKAGK